MNKILAASIILLALGTLPAQAYPRHWGDGPYVGVGAGFGVDVGPFSFGVGTGPYIYDYPPYYYPQRTVVVEKSSRSPKLQRFYKELRILRNEGKELSAKIARLERERDEAPAAQEKERLTTKLAETRAALEANKKKIAKVRTKIEALQED